MEGNRAQTPHAGSAWIVLIHRCSYRWIWSREQKTSMRRKNLYFGGLEKRRTQKDIASNGVRFGLLKEVVQIRTLPGSRQSRQHRTRGCVFWEEQREETEHTACSTMFWRLRYRVKYLTNLRKFRQRGQHRSAIQYFEEREKAKSTEQKCHRKGGGVGRLYVSTYHYHRHMIVQTRCA